MSEWIRIRIKDFYKNAVGEEEYAYVSKEVYEALADWEWVKQGRDGNRIKGVVPAGLR